MPHVGLDQTELSSPAAQSAGIFDREWALTILETALQKIRLQFAQAGRDNDFETLKSFLPGSAGAPSYEVAAAQLRLSVPGLKSDIHRLRRRFRELVREQVARTVSAPHEIEIEMQHLQHVLLDKGSELSPGGET